MSDRRKARRTFTVWCGALVLGLTSASTAPPASAQQRGYSVDDMLSLEQLGWGGLDGGAFAFAPDGGAFAFVLCRSRATSPRRSQSARDDRCDVFVQSAPGAEAINITNGVEDGSGWTWPSWSPDGVHLALSSTRLGGSLWVWNANTRDLRMLVPQEASYGSDAPARWLNATQMVFAARDPAWMSALEETQSTTANAWQASMEGVAPTSSILTSGLPVAGEIDEAKQSHLYVVDLSGNFTAAGMSEVDDWTVTQGGLAFIQNLPYSPAPGDDESIVRNGLSDVKVFNIDRMAELPLRQSRTPYAAALGPNIAGHSLRWSPSGQELAFLAHRNRTDAAPSLYRMDARTGRIRAYPLDPIVDAAVSNSVHWTDQGDVLVFGSLGPGESSSQPRVDWWKVTRTGSVLPLTSRFARAPRHLIAIHGRRSFAAVIDGDLWRISSDTGEAENLTPDLPPLSGNYSNGLVATYDRFVVSFAEGEATQYWVLNLTNGNRTNLASPSPDAELVDYSPVSGSAIFQIAGDEGLRLVRVDPDRPAQTLIERNQFLNDIATNRWQRIEYTSETGQALVGWLLLPYNYQEGRRYPMVTVPYPEVVYSGDDPLGSGGSHASRVSTDNAFNTQLLAGRGYVVLLPSMPLNPEGRADDPYLRLTEGTMPAVDRAIELGIADPERLYLLGASFGGFATYGLVTQTNRFRAAVAIAGYVDVMSSAGTFKGDLRYTDRPHLNTRHWDDNLGQTRMAVPPWQDPERYLRNSPIIHADRVETPIMMIHGDMDFVPMQQAEEFFRAMYAQGKRAEFVRYWGEEHAVQSPANQRDMWANIFRWFAEFGGVPVEPGDHAGTDMD